MDLILDITTQESSLKMSFVGKKEMAEYIRTMENAQTIWFTYAFQEKSLVYCGSTKDPNLISTVIDFDVFGDFDNFAIMQCDPYVYLSYSAGLLDDSDLQDAMYNNLFK